MSFDESIESGFTQIISVDILRAKSIYFSSQNALKTALEIELQVHRLKTIFRELYEALRELCEAIGYSKGYKFSSHQSITFFIADYLDEPSLSRKFDRYRKLRNGINYYGRSIQNETVAKARTEIPEIYQQLEQYLKIQ